MIRRLFTVRADRRSARQRELSRRLYQDAQQTARVRRALPPEEKP